MNLTTISLMTRSHNNHRVPIILFHIVMWYLDNHNNGYDFLRALCVPYNSPVSFKGDVSNLEMRTLRLREWSSMPSHKVSGQARLEPMAFWLRAEPWFFALAISPQAMLEWGTPPHPCNLPVPEAAMEMLNASTRKGIIRQYHCFSSKCVTWDTGKTFIAVYKISV